MERKRKNKIKRGRERKGRDGENGSELVDQNLSVSEKVIY